MWLSNKKAFQTMYQAVLILSTLGLTFYCIHKYNLDHSLSLVDFKRFHYSEKDLYPSLSLCFSDSISKEKFEEHHGGKKNVECLTSVFGHLL